MISYGFLKNIDAKGDFPLVEEYLKNRYGDLAVLRLRQIHSDRIYIDETGEGDGIIITRPSVGLIRTADCYPVVIFDEVSDIAGVFHSGWRGTELKIVSKGIKTMRDLGCRDLKAVIYPGIGFCCFEIGDELVGRFNAAGIKTENRDGRIFADLKSAIIEELGSGGVREVTDKSACTFCGGGYFSYRRDKTTARHATFVAITN